jgi:hypothetical protein
MMSVMIRRLSLMTSTTLIVIAMLGGCLPRSGDVEVIGAGFGKYDGGGDGALLADSYTPPGDTGSTTQDTGTVKPDTGGQPQPDTTPLPQPDSGPVGPQPPFGSSIGMTAANFVNIPDCQGTMHSLHPLFNKHKGFVIAMMSPS